MEQKNEFEKIPCPNCPNKILTMVSNVNNGIEIYKCRLCKALITYNHLTKNVIDIKRHIRKTNNVFKGVKPNK